MIGHPWMLFSLFWCYFASLKFTVKILWMVWRKKNTKYSKYGCQPMELSMFTESLGDLQVRAHWRRYIVGMHAELKGFLFIEYHVDNGFLIGESVHRHHLEKIRVLAFHGSVITITRDATVRDSHNKYTVELASLGVDQSEVWVDAWHQCVGKQESDRITAMANGISGEKQVISDSFYRRRYWSFVSDFVLNYIWVAIFSVCQFYSSFCYWGRCKKLYELLESFAN